MRKYYRFGIMAYLFFGTLAIMALSGCGSFLDERGTQLSNAIGDTTAPTVSSILPSDTSTDVATNVRITATFSEAMNFAAMDSSSFNLMRGTTPVSGAVTYSGNVAIFTPTNNLFASTLYTVNVTTGATDQAGNPLAANRVWSFTTGTTPDTTAPTVSSSIPGDTAANVATNGNLTATFGEDIDSTTMNTTTFTLTRDSTPVSGTVSSSGSVATFTPSNNLFDSTVYTATITTGAKDLAGNALASNRVWSFTTGTTQDTTAPTVSSIIPAESATGVAVNSRVTATFNESMNSSTVTSTSFTLMRGATPVSGGVSLSGNVATFTPVNTLFTSTVYTATISTEVKDLAGNALASNRVWSFTTGAAQAAGPAPVLLGTAGNFVILAKTAVSTTGNTSVTGDLGLSPAAASFITGFGLIMDSTTTFSTSSLVTGRVYAADYTPPTPANLTTAISNMETAYSDAAGRTLPDFTELGAGNIDGRNLTPGLYKWGTGVSIPSGVTLTGGANDVWIFQIAQDLTVGNGALVTLSGGAQAKNIFWQVAGQTTLGTTSNFKGVILCQTLIAVNTGAVITGRALAQTAVTLDANTVTTSN